MKKSTYILSLIISIFLLPDIVLGQTAPDNTNAQNAACAIVIANTNGASCSYDKGTQTGPGGPTQTNRVNGFCDRRGGVGGDTLYCNDEDPNGWEDCFKSGDACKKDGKLGTCSTGTPSNPMVCDTNKQPPGNPGGGVLPTSPNTPPSTTAGNVSYESYTNFPGVGRIRDLCQLINALWLLGFVVLLTSVLGMFLYGGYLYVTAGVNAGKVNQAKEIFTNTITGLIIGLSIFIVINIINPGLLQGNCSIPSAGSGTPGTPSTPGTPGTPPSNIVPQPGESVFPVTREYQCPGPRTSFGYARGRLHKGVDLTPPLSTISNSQALQLPILAFRDGTVTEIGSGVGAVRIDHGGGLNTRYLHNSRIFVRVGDRVQAGQEIAKMGDVGSPQVIHLHFEVYQNGSPVDPAPIIFDSSKNPDPSKVQTTGSPRCVGQNT